MCTLKHLIYKSNKFCQKIYLNLPLGTIPNTYSAAKIAVKYEQLVRLIVVANTIPLFLIIKIIDKKKL